MRMTALKPRGCMIAVRKLAAADKPATGRPDPLDHIVGATRRTLTQKVAVYGLKAEVVANNLQEFAC